MGLLSNIQISNEKFVEHEEKIVQLMHDCAIAAARKPRDGTNKMKSGHTAINALRRELKIAFSTGLAQLREDCFLRVPHA